jgi:hypothetical protein
MSVTTGPLAVTHRRRRSITPRNRKHEHPVQHLQAFIGILQADAYSGYNELYDPSRSQGAITAALCRVGGDVASPAPQRPGRADFPHPVLHAQASLTEQRIGGRSSQEAAGVGRAWLESVATANC